MIKHLFLFLLFLSPTLAHANEIPTPPPLVPCKTEATCDRDPKHLEAFMKEFYQWYIMDSLVIDQIPNTDQYRLKTYEQKHNNHIKELVTRKFYHHARTVKPFKDHYNPKYCWPGSDTFLCTQSYSEEWASSATTKVITSTNTATTISVDLNHGHKLIVTLSVERNAWRIDAIRAAS